MPLYQYTYDSSNWNQFFFGSPGVDTTFNHQGDLPILKIDSIDDQTSPNTLSVSAEYTYDFNSATHQVYFATPPAVNDTFTHTDGTTTLQIDAIDEQDFTMTVSEV